MKTVLLLLATAVLLPAQSPEAGGRFRTLGLGVTCADLYYQLDKKDVSVGVEEGARSVFYDLPPGKEVAFYRVGKAADGTLVRTPVLSAAVAGFGKQPLLIFSPDPSGPAPFKVEVIADDLKSFPAGTYRVFNRTDVSLGCLLGGSPTVVPARAVQLLDKKPAAGSRTLFFQVFPVGAKDNRPLYSNNWAWNPLLRTMVVASPPEPPATLPSIRRIVENTDDLAPPAASPPAP